MMSCENCKNQGKKCKHYTEAIKNIDKPCSYKEISDNILKCKHDFIEKQKVNTGFLSGCTIGEKTVLKCVKCGYKTIIKNRIGYSD